MRKNKQICPLTYGMSKGAYDQEIGDFDFCVEEQCTWWVGDEANQKCALAEIAINLKILRDRTL